MFFLVPLVFKSSCGPNVDTVQRSPLATPNTKFAVSTGNINPIYTAGHSRCPKDSELKQIILQTFTYLQATCRFRIMA